MLSPQTMACCRGSYLDGVCELFRAQNRGKGEEKTHGDRTKKTDF